MGGLVVGIDLICSCPSLNNIDSHFSSDFLGGQRMSAEAKWNTIVSQLDSQGKYEDNAKQLKRDNIPADGTVFGWDRRKRTNVLSV